ncbi:hypothetical protein PENTCL1PPCAC_13428 [Pristionchus entomophagus]|uniref:Uncharacterized protein n=1 Tax=Pristionchus entomophagus TaxID=358040 RepID=A0AAV5TAZ2_9BILA|nr:hypothetical protein PENTCL1PPCAC_13428 [Pristionchus entomophagus]
MSGWSQSSSNGDKGKSRSPNRREGGRGEIPMTAAHDRLSDYGRSSHTVNRPNGGRDARLSREYGRSPARGSEGRSSHGGERMGLYSRSPVRHSDGRPSFGGVRRGSFGASQSKDSDGRHLSIGGERRRDYGSQSTQRDSSSIGRETERKDKGANVEAKDSAATVMKASGQTDSIRVPIHWSEEDERRYGSGERRDERKGSSVRETVNRRRTHETRKRIGESSHSIDKKMDRSERDSAAEMDTKIDGSETRFREMPISESIDKSLILSNPLYNSVVGHNR